MKFATIAIKNLGVYEASSIRLDAANSGLVFINGNNGRGKTTLINALKWCLFDGKRPSVANGVKLPVPKNPVEVSVTVEIELDPTVRIEIKKSQDDGTELQIEEPHFHGKERVHGQPTNTIRDVEERLSRIFPKKLENFILFDAEQLANFFTPDTRTAIQNAVLEIAGVESLDIAIQGLREQASKVSRDLAKLGGSDSSEMQAKVNELDEQIQEQTLSLSTDETNLELAKEDLSSTVLELAKLDYGRKNFENYQNKKADLEDLKAQLLLESKDFDSKLTRSAYQFILGASLHEVDTFYKQGLSAGLPMSFPTESLREVAKMESCICGCELGDSDHGKILRKLIEKQALAEGIDQALPSTKNNASQMLTTISSISKDLITQNKLVTLLRSEIKASEKEISALGDALPVAADWDGLLEKQRRLEARTKNLEASVRQYGQDIAGEKAERASLAAKVERSIQSSKESSLLRSRLRFIDAVSDGAKAVRVKAVELVRGSLEDAMNELYSNIKGGEFKVEISNQFEVGLVNADSQAMSEGEKMSLAYAFALAIRQTLNMQFPLVVDSAFGKLDSQNRLWLSEAVVRMLQDGHERQAVFLMHDLEYTPETKNWFAEGGPSEFYIRHDAKTQISEFADGLDPEWFNSGPWAMHG